MSANSKTMLYQYRVRDGHVVGSELNHTTFTPETRLYSYHQLSNGAYVGSAHLSDVEALQYNLTTDGGCFVVPFTQSEHIRTAVNKELRRYTFRCFQDGSITGEAWMTDEDALQFNLNSSKAVYAIPWVPPEQLSQTPPTLALTKPEVLALVNV